MPPVLPLRWACSFLLLPAAMAGEFSRSVDPGNHRVEVALHAGGGRPAPTLYAESRQLLFVPLTPEPPPPEVRSFVVNTRTPDLPAPPPHAPGATAVTLNPREHGINRWDDRLTLQWVGPDDAVAVRRVSPAGGDTPTLYLLGDSTVTDQPTGDYASWGQMLPAFFDGTVAVANHAESGETLKSFLFTHRLNKVLTSLRPGDTVLIQFGHNDQKSQWPQTHVAADSTWPAYLRVYVAEIQRRGGRPVLVSSPERRTFDDQDRIRSTHGVYPAVVEEVARAGGIPFIDLRSASITLYEKLGPEQSVRAFANGGRDATHHNPYGAFLLAAEIARGLHELSLPVAAHLNHDLLRAELPAIAAHVMATYPGTGTATAPRGD